jgi:hypothetical protein
MKVCKRILAVLTVLLATAGLLLSLAGIVGVWIVREPVTERATWVFGRIAAALKDADRGLDHVKTSLARAADRLDTVKEEQRKLAQGSRRPSGLRGFLARKVQQSVAPKLGDAHESLQTVAEAAVVVNSVLEDVGSFPFLSVSGLDVGPLTEINRRLANVGPQAWELSRLLGAPEPDADTAAQFTRVERTLKTMRGLLAQYEPRLTQVRERTEELKARTLSWITPGAIGISLVCFWIALSQVSVLFHAWSWWRAEPIPKRGQDF